MDPSRDTPSKLRICDNAMTYAYQKEDTYFIELRLWQRLNLV